MATETLTETTEVELTAEEAAQEVELLNAIEENVQNRPAWKIYAISTVVFFFTSFFVNSYAFGGFFGQNGIFLGNLLRAFAAALFFVTIIQGIKYAGSVGHLHKMMRTLGTLHKAGVGRK